MGKKTVRKIELKLPHPFIGLYPSCSGIILVKNDVFKYNLMPVGLVGSPSLNPPTIGVSIYKGHYTYKLLSKSKEFTFNLIDEKLVNSTIYLGSVSGRNVDKLKKSGLHVKKSKIIETPILSESPVNIECKVIKKINIGNFGYFIGQILFTHISSDVYNKKEEFLIDFKKAKPVAALFLKFYGIKDFLGKYIAN